MHLHGHNFYVLAVGTGTWDGTIVNPSNPQRRDTQLVPPERYVVLQIALTNPGVWPFVSFPYSAHPISLSLHPVPLPLGFPSGGLTHGKQHCHVAWHVSQGMNINLLELPSDIPAMAFPNTDSQNCIVWNRWTKGYIIAEIDSGV